MNPILRVSIITVSFIFTYGLLNSNCSYADEATNEISAIQAKWIPNFDLGTFSLSITNKTNHPIKVSHNLTIIYGTPDHFHSFGYPVDDAVEIKPSIKFIATPGLHWMGGLYGSGQGARSSVIAPGDTEMIKFRPDDFFITCAQNSIQANFLLSFNKKDFKKYIMKNLNNIWKEE